MVRTFFIIFMVMESREQNRREKILKLHQQLLGQELGQGTGVVLHNFKVEKSKEKLPINGPMPQVFVLHFVVTGTEAYENMIIDALTAYYEMMKDICLLDYFKVASIVFTGGLHELENGGINIIDPSLNLLAAYDRHWYVIPSYIMTIEAGIAGGRYKINDEAIGSLKTFFHAADMQQGVIGRAAIRLKQLRRGRLQVKWSRESEDMATVEYEYPEDKQMEATVDAGNHYKIKPTVKFELSDLQFHLPDQERESFLAMDENAQRHFRHSVFNEFEKTLNKYNISVEHSQWTDTPTIN